MSERTWSIDISVLTGADFGKLLQADEGDLTASQELLERVVKPNIEALPLADWEIAREEMVKVTLDAVFRRENTG